MIDGRDAETATGLNFWNEERRVIKIGGSNTPPDGLPAYRYTDIKRRFVLQPRLKKVSAGRREAGVSPQAPSYRLPDPSWIQLQTVGQNWPVLPRECPSTSLKAYVSYPHHRPDRVKYLFPILLTRRS